MKNKNGFTLIELLAVIVILGIIVIIAIPQVMSSLKSAKKNSVIVEARKAINLAMQKYNENTLNSTTDIDNCFTFTEIGLAGGDKYSGSVAVSTAGVFTVYIWDGEYGFNNKGVNDLKDANMVTSAPTNVTSCGK